MSRYYIDWNQSAAEVSSFIRGLSPYPGAWTQLKNQAKEKTQQLKIFDFKSPEQQLHLSNGELMVENNQFFIGTENEVIEITALQLEGKKRMKTKELLNGMSLEGYKVV